MNKYSIDKNQPLHKFLSEQATLCVDNDGKGYYLIPFVIQKDPIDGSLFQSGVQSVEVIDDLIEHLEKCRKEITLESKAETILSIDLQSLIPVVESIGGDGDIQDVLNYYKKEKKLFYSSRSLDGSPTIPPTVLDGNIGDKLFVDISTPKLREEAIKALNDFKKPTTKSE